jgi:uncharacterized RDD family membrane protein YckC
MGDLVCVEEGCPQFGQPFHGRLCPSCGQLMEAVTGAPLLPRRSAFRTTAVVMQQQAVPAGLGARLLARVIDGVVLTVPIVVLAWTRPDADLINGLFIAWYAFVLFYEYVMLAAFDGQTVGKWAMRVRVVKLDGAPIGWGSAAGRVFVQTIASSCSCGLAGFLFALSPLFDSGPWNRGWPDKIASTVVIRAVSSG